MAADIGFDCYVVDDATATFERTRYDGKRYSADEMHSTALASLNNGFAEIVRTGTLLDRL
jgi:nicotinamidase-related amidase